MRGRQLTTFAFVLAASVAGARAALATLVTEGVITEAEARQIVP